MSRTSPSYQTLRRHWYDLQSRSFYRSYNLRGEDLLLRAFLPSNKGFYIDVGCGRAKRHSTTYLFYRAGWRGILIDPIESNIRECRRKRPHDTSILALAGQSAGTSTITEFDEYVYSSAVPSAVEAAVQRGARPVREITRPVVALRDLTIAPEPGVPTLLNVDVEGGELAVLAGNDWDRFRPDIVFIEEWTPPFDAATEVSQFMHGLGYRLCAYSGLTSAYASPTYNL